MFDEKSQKAVPAESYSAGTAFVVCRIHVLEKQSEPEPVVRCLVKLENGVVRLAESCNGLHSQSMSCSLSDREALAVKRNLAITGVGYFKHQGGKCHGFTTKLPFFRG